MFDPIPPGTCSLVADLATICTPDLDQEWVVSNGIGGYASLSATACPTRRQHGLLVAARTDIRQRFVFLSRIEEVLHRAGETMQLNVAEYAGARALAEHPFLREVAIYPNPSFVYEWKGLVVRREVVATPAPGVRVIYTFSGTIDSPVRVHLRPLTPFREADHLTHENFDLRPFVERTPNGRMRVQPYTSLPVLAMSVLGKLAQFTADPVWYRNILLRRDEERGYDCVEDHFSCGYFERTITEPCQIIFEAEVEGVLSHAIESGAYAAEGRHQTQVGDELQTLRAALHAASELYFYRAPGERLGILAGFPWFAEWGRDTFIALPGLTICRGRLDLCRAVLDGVLPYLHATGRNGLVPNIFGETPNVSRYNSIDAALWFARAVDLYDQADGRRQETAEHFLPALLTIARAYRGGISQLSVSCDGQGILHLNDSTRNLTWMDAMIDGVAMTPRVGAPVEINALWYAMLDQILDYAQRCTDFNDEIREFEALRDTLGSAFCRSFWYEPGRYLADLWKSDGTSDPCVRPNMVIAASLARSPLALDQRRGIVERARLDLLTPRGLRTLAPSDEHYLGRYHGDQAQRDAAYHQGTVWPWLLGPYVEASLRIDEGNERIDELSHLLAGFVEHLREIGLGQISEVFDGDAPHRPGGTPAQAWSVAELSRALEMLEQAKCAS
jgi:predicted glycogen debranching enzyme